LLELEPSGKEVRVVEVGSRVEVESEKVGVEPRLGTVTAVKGSQVQVRWDDGAETTFFPGPGVMRVVDTEKGSAK
jgi:hypothetical protein